MADVRPPLGVFFSEFGVAATVTVPSGSPVAATVIWLAPQLFQIPTEVDERLSEPRKVLALRRSEVATAPAGTTIVAPEKAGEASKTWRVVGLADAGGDNEHLRVIVVQV
jgi:hypothetical protein